MSTVFLHITQQIDEACRDIEQDLALGHVKDFSEYKFACGRHRGLLTAKDIIIKVAESMEEDDE